MITINDHTSLTRPRETYVLWSQWCHELIQESYQRRVTANLYELTTGDVRTVQG